MVSDDPIPSDAIPPSLRVTIAAIYREAAGSYRAIGQPAEARKLEVKADALLWSDRRIVWEGL